MRFLSPPRRALEAKAVLYEKLSRGEGLRELEEEEEEGEEGRYMVDFTRKIAEQVCYVYTAGQTHAHAVNYVTRFPRNRRDCT